MVASHTRQLFMFPAINYLMAPFQGGIAVNFTGPQLNPAHRWSLSCP
jgi:hypothetical protein